MSASLKFLVLSAIQEVHPTRLQGGWRKIGDYSVNFEDQISYGRFSKVYSGTNSRGVKVAVKVLPKREIMSRTRKRDLEREIQNLRALKGEPHIVNLLEVYDSHTHYYFIFERLGRDLLDVIEKRKFLTEESAKPIVRDVALGIQSVHSKGMVHRDIKAENILTGSKTKICDFEFSQSLPLKGYIFRSCGSLWCIPPEMIKKKGYREEVDIWSFGCLVFRMLTGIPPFSGPDNRLKALGKRILENNRRPIPENLSSDAKDFLEALLQWEPDKRPTIQEVLNHPWLG